MEVQLILIYNCHVIFTVLKDTIQAIDKIEGDKVVLHELPSFMKSMGIYLSEKDFQEALNQVSVDGEYRTKMFTSHPSHWQH